MEIRGPPAGGAAKATRYYTLAGTTVALRKAGEDGVTWLTNDAQASAQIAIQSQTGTVQRQRYLPYGAHRGGRDDITATERGFLGKTEDASTGLAALDNRYYDPGTGRFINPDPITSPGDSQSLNPYTYAANNPASKSDPSGLRECADSNQSICAANPNNPASAGLPGFISWSKATCYYCKSRGERAYDVFEGIGFIPGIDTIGDAGTLGMDIWNGDWGSAGVTAIAMGLPAPGVAKGFKKFFGIKTAASKAADHRKSLEAAAIKNAQDAAKKAQDQAAEAVADAARATSQRAAAKARQKAGRESSSRTTDLPDPIMRPSKYRRPSGATTPAQRASVQGSPCVTCGNTAPRQVTDHKYELVREHYETGTIDRVRMRSIEAVQPQCPTCSARQGASMRQYSLLKRKLHLLDGET